MGRFSPTVAPTWGQSFGHALEGGVDAFLLARRQKQGQEDEMFARGYRPATDAETQPAPAPAPTPFQPGTTAETNAGIVRGVQPLAGPDGAQALAGGPPPNFKGRPQPGQPVVDPQLLSAALANHVQSGQPLRAPDAAQPTPQAVGQALASRHPLQMGGRQWMRTDESQAAMDQAAQDRALKELLTHSEIFKNTAQGTRDLRDPTVQPTSYEHLVDPVTGRVTFFDPKHPPANLAINPVPRPAAEVGGAQKFQADQRNKVIDDFRADTKKFEDVRSGWEVLNGALKERSLATPFALADAYARISNPGALVRPTTLEMIDNLGSLDQRFKKFAEHNINGQLPEDITRDLVRTIGSMVKEHANTYTQQRGMALKRGQQMGINDLDPILPTFEYADPFATPGKPGAVVGAPGSRAPTRARRGVGGDTGNVDLGQSPHVQTIDEMIRAGASDAQIRAAVRRGVQ